jgi:hypothetical protein
MPSPPKFRLVLHPSGMWEASAVVERQELHFGFFADQAEAQRTLESAAARFGGDPRLPRRPGPALERDLLDLNRRIP